MDSGWPDALPRAGNLRLDRVDGISPWFEIFGITEDTYALLEPNHLEEVICYLILGTERAVLFDPGTGIGDIRAEVRRLTDLLLIVINSHSHYDHIGGNHCFN